ncbi:MAG: sugar phosphate isomerase/epimerase family protein [Planctomycetia bacterium]|nr:sugar phosphate isomerase/epimerase family protein [Planctomycetia bacterium]
MMNFNRREMMKRALVAGSFLGMGGFVFADQKKFTYQVGAWMNGLSAFDRAKKSGLDTVQMSFPFKEGGDADFRSPEVCRKFVERSKEIGIPISSLALADFNGNPLWLIEDAEQRVSACIDAMVRLGVKAVLVPFFGKAVLNEEERFKITIERIKRLAPKAKDAGVILAIESTLDSAGHLRIINEVDSPAVQVFYDPGNMIRNFGDTDGICADIRRLKGLIAAVHAKDSTLLGEGKIDYKKILDTYREIGFFGPQILEGSKGKGIDMNESNRRNAIYLRSI